MHPFGGPQYCPRCSKPVYAAEQVIGPGRKLYHKPCLACVVCNKRLDSYTLLEHDEKPYCKNCHVKQFATRDLRHANLPYAPPPDDDDAAPDRTSQVRPSSTADTTPLRLRPTRTLTTSPTSPTFPQTLPSQQELESEDQDVITEPVSPSYPSNTGRPGIGTLPRTVPLQTRHYTSRSIDTTPSRSDSADDVTPATSASATPVKLTHQYTNSFPEINVTPLKQTPTGTRYGAALGGGIGVHMTGSPRKWGTATPQCGRCGKSVYFAEQVKAVGKVFHKPCLRCTECGTTLDSNRLRDHDGDPFCVRCYSRLHGPQGSGYALLGKAGG